jgi:hypothetical protein
MYSKFSHSVQIAMGCGISKDGDGRLELFLLDQQRCQASPEFCPSGLSMYSLLGNRKGLYGVTLQQTAASAFLSSNEDNQLTIPR